MAEMSTTYISTLPTGSAGGSKYLVQDDGNNTTKVTVNDAVASATAMTSANSSISSINTKIGSVTLPTTAQTLTGAIAEHEGDITELNGNLVVGEFTATMAAGATGSIYQIVKFGRIVVVSFYIATTQAFTKNATLATLPSAITNYSKGAWAIGATESNAIYRVSIAASSNIVKADMAIPSGVGFFGQFVYVTAS